jgi:proline iminopeptidase
VVHLKFSSKAKGELLYITHFYSEFNETGDYFAETFVSTHKVFFVNLRQQEIQKKLPNPTNSASWNLYLI